MIRSAGRLQQERLKFVLVIAAFAAALGASVWGLCRSRFFTPALVVGPVRWRQVQPMVIAGVAFLAYFLWAFMHGAMSKVADANWPRNMTLEVFFRAGSMLMASVLLIVLQQTLFSLAMAQAGALDDPDLEPTTPEARRHELGHGLKVGALGTLLALPWVLGVTQLSSWVIRSFGVEVPTEHELLKSIRESPDALRVAAVACSAVVAAPILEELLFRGLIQTFWVNLLRKVPTLQGREAAVRWSGILLTSAIFAVLHPAFSWAGIFLLSVGLGYVYERTGRLTAPLVMHALFNATSVTLTFLMQ